MAGTRRVKEVTTCVPPLGKCQQDPSPREAGGSALGAWPAGLGCSRGGDHRGSLKLGGGDGAGGEDRPSRGTAHAKAWGGTQHSSDGLQQGARVGWSGSTHGLWSPEKGLGSTPGQGKGSQGV